MRILGLDTATAATAVALCDFGPTDTILEARDDPPRGQRPAHATKLMALIANVLERSGAGWDQIDLIAAGVGPGTFTGLRIGIATARAIAQARRIPLAGVSTLQSLALNAQALGRAGQPETILTVLDARRGEAFAAAWSAEDVAAADERLPAALVKPRTIRPEALGASLAALRPPVLALGDGAVEFQAILERSGALVPGGSEPHRVSAVNHCRLGRFLQGGPPERTAPEYLRAPDAEIAHRPAGS